MTVEGEMVYCIPISGMHDFRVQVFKGESYLTYWNGLNAPFPQVGKGYGQVTFADSTYKNFSLTPSSLTMGKSSNSLTDEKYVSEGTFMPYFVGTTVKGVRRLTRLAFDD